MGGPTVLSEIRDRDRCQMTSLTCGTQNQRNKQAEGAPSLQSPRPLGAKVLQSERTQWGRFLFLEASNDLPWNCTVFFITLTYAEHEIFTSGHRNITAIITFGYTEKISISVWAGRKDWSQGAGSGKEARLQDLYNLHPRKTQHMLLYGQDCADIKKI